MLALIGLSPLFHDHLKIREDDYIAYFFKELLAVWSVEWLAKPVFARQDRVMAAHNGTTAAVRAHFSRGREKCGLDS
jgi:hypothetical protein